MTPGSEKPPDPEKEAPPVASRGRKNEQDFGAHPTVAGSFVKPNDRKASDYARRVMENLIDVRRDQILRRRRKNEAWGNE